MPRGDAPAKGIAAANTSQKISIHVLDEELPCCGSKGE